MILHRKLKIEKKDVRKLKKIYTLEEAVYSFGDEKKIASFEKSKAESKKGQGNLNSRSIDSLVKDIECHFESVTIEGMGAGRQFISEGEKEFVTAKEDSRQNNGAKPPYEYEINSLVLDYVLKNCNNKFVSMALNGWLVNVGLVDWRLCKALYSEFTRSHHIKQLREKYGDEFLEADTAMIQHFALNEMNKLRGNLESVFNTLAKKKIIIHKKEKYGCVKGSKTHRPLTDEEITAIANLKRTLCEKHNIKLKDLTFKHSNKSVIAYKEEFSKELGELGFSYTYESHGCVVQVSDKVIKEYIDKLNEKDELVICYGLNEINIAMMVYDFQRLYGDASLEKAGERQNRLNSSDSRYIKHKKVFEEYLPMWEKLLIFYDLTNYSQVKLEKDDKDNPFSPQNIENDDDSDLPF